MNVRTADSFTSLRGRSFGRTLEIMVRATNPSLKALEVLAGRWEMVIRWSPKTHELVGGPASVRGDAHFDWIEDGRALVLRQGGNGAPQASWVIGRDEASDGYCVLYADSRGISRVYEMSFAGGVWRIWRNAAGFSQRFEGRVSVDGRTIDGWWEKSTDGQSWERDFDLTYVKAS